MEWLSKMPPLPEELEQQAQLEREAEGVDLKFDVDGVNWVLAKRREINQRNPIPVAKLVKHLEDWMAQMPEEEQVNGHPG